MKLTDAGGCLAGVGYISLINFVPLMLIEDLLSMFTLDWYLYRFKLKVVDFCKLFCLIVVVLIDD